MHPSRHLTEEFEYELLSIRNYRIVLFGLQQRGSHGSQIYPSSVESTGRPPCKLPRPSAKTTTPGYYIEQDRVKILVLERFVHTSLLSLPTHVGDDCLRQLFLHPVACSLVAQRTGTR